MMNEEVRVTRNTNSREAQVHSQVSSLGRSNFPWPWVIVIVVIIAALLVVFRGELFGGNEKSEGAQEDMKYQAIFLTNNQVYFGKLDKKNKNKVRLTDIFYLQVSNQPPLQGSQEEGSSAQAQQPKLQLVKLGNELHGPEDEMFINPDHILFYEDLKEDGRVVQAIKEYKSTPKSSGGNTQQQSQPTATPPPAIQK